MRGLVVLLLVLLAGCSRASFNTRADVGDVRQALEDGQLQVCAAQPLAWTATPGFVRGEYLEVSLDCATGDPVHPGARVWVAQFDSVGARDLALRNAEDVYRRHIGESRT